MQSENIRNCAYSKEEIKQKELERNLLDVMKTRSDEVKKIVLPLCTDIEIEHEFWTRGLQE